MHIPGMGAVPLRYISLVLLTLNSCLQAIVMRQSRLAAEAYSPGASAGADLKHKLNVQRIISWSHSTRRSVLETA